MLTLMRGELWPHAAHEPLLEIMDHHKRLGLGRLNLWRLLGLDDRLEVPQYLLISPPSWRRGPNL